MRSVCGGILTAETKEIVITYTENEGFSADTLKIKLKNEPASEWAFGDEFETLGGTNRTLDMSHGRVPTDNGDVKERVSRIVAEAKVSTSRKGFIDSAMQMDHYDNHYKTCRINFDSYEDRNFEGAIKEQLTLLRDEYEE